MPRWEQMCLQVPLLWWAGLAVAQEPATVPVPPRPLPAKVGNETEREDKQVVSQSRLFAVSGGDKLRMGAIAQRADEIRAQLNSLLKDSNKWKHVISIRLLGQYSDPPVENPIRTRISIIGNEPSLQIRIYPGGGIDLQRLTQAIISMLLFERAIRDVPAESLPAQISLPPWLPTGISQAIMWRNGTADRRLYRNLFNRSDMLSPQEIISNTNPAELDAPARQLYDVSCGVLIMSLLNRPDGADQLRDLVSEAITSEGTPTEIISRHFVELGVDENMLSQWWALELAGLSMPRATDALSPLETEDRLEEALTVLYYDPATRVPRPVSVDNAYELMELPDWQKLVRPCLDRLLELSMSCFPDYRPVIVEYQRAIQEMLRGASADDLQSILGPLREIRMRYVQISIRARDYLDWYEITQLGGSKLGDASFASFREAMEMLRTAVESPDSAMSRYLEDIEKLYGLGEDSPLPKRMREEIKNGVDSYKKQKRRR